MVSDDLKLSGQLNIVLTDKAGNIKDEREVKNLVVTSGLAYIASRMFGTAKNVMSHMALGSGTVTPAAAQTDLTSILGTREALDSTFATGTNNEKVPYTCSFEAGDATGAVTEAGIFNAASGSDMLCRTVFDVVNKAADDTISVTWTITLSAA
jgi:hypothetical protein